MGAVTLTRCSLTRCSLAALLAGVTLVGCAWRFDWPLHEVYVQLTHNPATSAPWVTGRGELRVDHLYVTVDSVLLQPCQQEQGPSGYGALWTSVAWAHGDATPTLVAAPLVMDLLGEPQQIQVGSWTPPQGRYCEARLWLAAADEDALQLSQAPWMEGLSAALEGSYQGQPVRWTTRAALEARVPLDPPLVLGSQDQDVTFLARWNLPQSWSSPDTLARSAEQGRLPDALLLALGEALEAETWED